VEKSLFDSELFSVACVVFLGALGDQYGDGRSNRDGIVAKVNGLLHPKDKAAKKPRLALKLGGLSISVTAGKDKLNVANLLSVFDRVCKEAKSLKDGGKNDVEELAKVLKAS
jgi:hypothetical protein